MCGYAVRCARYKEGTRQGRAVGGVPAVQDVSLKGECIEV